MMCGLPNHTSLGYELYITKLLLTLNQKLQLHQTYKVFFVLLEVSQLYILMASMWVTAFFLKCHVGYRTW